ncbi:hypothetical protein ACPUEK_15920 [Marinomonas gallaica]|uniref:hypothetical protein n=1 Tax=Marinomonas gallaica TaxID=1806667 RepID=UPI003CE5C3B8
MTIKDNAKKAVAVAAKNKLATTVIGLAVTAATGVALPEPVTSALAAWVMSLFG